MNLLKALFSILNLWRPAFCKKAAFIRAKELAIASLCAFNRKTITNMAIYLGRGQKLPVADYKFYSEYKWNVEDLFNPILQKATEYSPGDYISVAADDTRIHKTGKKIPNASWHADPLGPKFQTNLIWGLRYLQMSILLPLYLKSENTPARAIPIRFTLAPHVKKPGKKSTEEDRQHYKILSKQKNLSTTFVQEVINLRRTLDSMGFDKKILLMSCDGSFCNKNCMNIDDRRIAMIARCRKDAKLCFKNEESSRRFYSEKTFTAEEVRKDENIPWQTKSFFYGGKRREIRYKEVKNVLWRNGTKRKFVRLIVLAPLPYIRGGRRNYRDPAYVLTTSLDAPIEILIQAYLDRWQIEYNHRDEKSILGVGEAQVWNEYSVKKQPAFHVAIYSALLLASVMVYGDKEHTDFGPRPKWRKPPKRNTCRALIGLLRATLLEEPEELMALEITVPIISAILKQAA